MTDGSGRKNKHFARLEKQMRQVRRVTTPFGKALSSNEFIDKVLSESTVSARAASEFMNQSETFRIAIRVAKSASPIQDSLVKSLNAAYSTKQLEQLAVISQTPHLSIIDSGMAARVADLLSKYDASYLTGIRLPQTHFLSERLSNLMRDLYFDIEAEYPYEAEKIKGAADTLELDYLKSNPEGITLKQCITALSLFVSLVAAYYAIADYYGNKKFQEQLLNSQTEIIGQMYELNSHIASVLPEEAETQTDMIEYVVIRAVNLRTEYHTGKSSHVITTLMPNQKVELLKQAEHPNKKWIYVGYRDNIAGIPRTGWVYKKYLKRLER